MQLYAVYFVHSILVYKLVRAELYMSMQQLNRLTQQLSTLVSNLESYIADEYTRLYQLEKQLNGYKALVEQSTSDQRRFLGNPVNVVKLVKSLSKNYKELKSFIGNEQSAKSFLNFEKSNKMPTYEDYTDSVFHLFKLHDMYFLNHNNTRLGRLDYKYPSNMLTALECYELGTVAFENTNPYHAVNWMIAALDQLYIEDDNYTIFAVPVLEILANATAQEGNIEYAIYLNKAILNYFLDPQYPDMHEKAKENIKLLKKLLDSEELQNMDSDDASYLFGNYKHIRPDISYYEYNYETLCRQQYDLGNRNASCRYFYIFPYYPIKEETLLDEPQMYLYYDVISDRQMSTIKTLLSDENDPKSNNDQVLHTLNRVSQFIKNVKNVPFTTSDEWKIESQLVLRKRQRFAMIELYFEVPDEGGATVFPDPVNFHIKPPRKSALFYFNTNQNSTVDSVMRHYECPILFGSKFFAKLAIYKT